MRSCRRDGGTTHVEVDATGFRRLVQRLRLQRQVQQDFLTSSLCVHGNLGTGDTRHTVIAVSLAIGAAYRVVLHGAGNVTRSLDELNARVRRVGGG